MTENFPKLMKDINQQIQESQATENCQHQSLMNLLK